MSLLKLENVSYIKNDNYILKDISFEVSSGDYINIEGPSGSGKSTLLKLISSLTSPSSGNIFFENINYNNYNFIELRKEISYCQQEACLIQNTVMDDFLFLYNLRKKDLDLEYILKLLEEFNLSKDILDKTQEELSGGELQRINLIRSILLKPKILLLDEVTSNLDYENKKNVQNIIKNLNNKNITILSISHDPLININDCNKTLVIKSGKILSKEISHGN